MSADLTVLLCLVAALAVIYAGVVFGIWLDRRPSGQPRSPRPELSQLLTLLDSPVILPAAYPDSWSEFPDMVDDRLADLEARLWPDEEWLSVLECPHPGLDAYRSREAAERKCGRSSQVRGCPCGAHHIYKRRRRRARR